MKHLLTSFLCVAMLCGICVAQNTADTFKTKLADMQSADANKVKNAQQDWQKLCFQAGAPGQESVKAEVVKLMADALDKNDLNTATRYWLVRQLGRLDNGDNAELIGKFLDDSDKLVQDEAVWSLANIPNEKAGKVLQDRLAKETNADKKVAYQNAIDFRAGQKAADLPKLEDIVKTLEGSDEKTWDLVLPKLHWLTDVTITDVANIKDRFTKLSPAAQSLLMDALGSKRDKNALPIAIDMTKSDNEQISFAGFRALGLLGGASELPLLLDNVNAQDDLGNTVRNSLARMNFDNADKAIMDAFDKSDNEDVKSNLLNVLTNRKGTIAVPVFESGLKSTNERTKRDSIRSLEIIGQQESISALVDSYFAETKKDIRDAIERAIVQIESRYGDADGRGKALCEKTTKQTETQQEELLPILGKISGPAAKDFVLDKYKNGTPKMQEAAFRSLCNWTDASVADELHKVAAADDAKGRIAARAYIRIVTLHEQDRSDANKIAYVEKAFAVAKSDDDRNFLLTRLDPSRHIEVFRMAVKHIDNPALEQAACQAVVDLANDTGFHNRHRAEIEKYLDVVIEKSKDRNHVDRAKRYKARR